MGIARHPEVEGFEAYSSFHTVKSFDGYREHSIAGAEGIDPESVTKEGRIFRRFTGIASVHEYHQVFKDIGGLTRKCRAASESSLVRFPIVPVE